VDGEADLHPDLRPLSGLLGTWRGEGKGEYATIESFAYGEEVRFWHVGKPFFLYTQRTWTAEDSRPLHSEMGYWRVVGEGRMEVVLAHPTGVTEVAEGRFVDGVIELGSTRIGLTSTAKEVSRLERTYRLDGNVLSYDLRMAAVGQPLAGHLRAELRRSP
jgi:nitrobindin-like protein